MIAKEMFMITYFFYLTIINLIKKKKLYWTLDSLTGLAKYENSNSTSNSKKVTEMATNDQTTSAQAVCSDYINTYT